MISQDSSGNIWYGGATTGISRYDGKTYRRFTTADGLPGASVTSFLQTRDGTIWVGTVTGLARLEGERFVSLTTADGLSGNYRQQTLFILVAASARRLTIAQCLSEPFQRLSTGKRFHLAQMSLSAALVGPTTISTPSFRRSSSHSSDSIFRSGSKGALHSVRSAMVGWTFVARRAGT